MSERARGRERESERERVGVGGRIEVAFYCRVAI